jgi:hypothetical protein
MKAKLIAAFVGFHWAGLAFPFLHRLGFGFALAFSCVVGLAAVLLASRWS